jgi:hypothetical protein
MKYLNSKLCVLIVYLGRDKALVTNVSNHLPPA